MKPVSTLSKGCALTLLACLAAACNPFEGIDPRAASTNGHSASNDMCAIDPDLGRCPVPPPTDIKG
jgi:hypothetical protein